MNERTESSGLTPNEARETFVERFRRMGIIAWAVIGVLVLSGVFLWGVTRVTDVFPPLVIALVSVYVLNPVVTWLETFGVRRLFGSCMTYLILIAVVAITLGLLIPTLVEQGQQFGRDFPRTVERLNEFAVSVLREVESRIGTDLEVTEWLGARSELAPRVIAIAGSFLQGAVQTLALVALGLVAGFYLLIDLPRLGSAALHLVPPGRRGEARQIAAGVSTAIGGFFRGSLLLALIVGILTSLGFRILGLPYWLVLGSIAGAFNLLPLIGPFIGAAPAIIVAAALRPPSTMVWVAVVVLVVQGTVNYFVAPNIMRLTVRMHPVTVMISLLAGGTLAGFWGLLLAVPVVASIKVIVAHLWRNHVPWGEEIFRDAERMESIPHEQIIPGIVLPPPAPSVSEPADGTGETTGPTGQG